MVPHRDRPTGREASARGARASLARRLALWIGGGVLVGLPFVVDELEILGFVSFVPWLLAIELEAGSARGGVVGRYLRAYAGVLTFLLVGLWWLNVVSPIALAVTAGYFALYHAGWAVALAAVRRVLDVPLWLIAPPSFLASEVIIQHVTLFPVTWLFQGYASWRLTPVIQVAELGGIQLVSALHVAVAATAVHVGLRARRRGVRVLRERATWAPVALTIACLAAAWSYGAWRIAGLDLVPGPLVALVQGNVPQAQRVQPANADAIVEKHVALTMSARAAAPHVVVWPESASNHFLESDEPLQRLLGDTARAMDAWLVVGSIGENPSPEPPSNSAYLFAPDGRRMARADKRILVPGAETLLILDHVPPLRDRISDFLSRTMHFRPYLKRGERAVVFHAENWSYGPMICYGDLVPDPSEELQAAGADVLLVASNEAWFGERELDQHVAMATVRSVETRLPMGRATNDGLTVTIDPVGRVRERLPRETDGVLVDRLLVTETFRVPAWARRLFMALVTGACLAVLVMAVVLERRARAEEAGRER